jgi:hypothetical protein
VRPSSCYKSNRCTIRKGSISTRMINSRREESAVYPVRAAGGSRPG